MNYLVEEESKEYLESIIVPVELKNPVRIFDGYVESKSNLGYIIDDLFFAKAEHVYPLIFESTLINRFDNAVELTYKVENIGEYTKRENVTVELEPVYYNGGGSITYPGGKTIQRENKKIFSYFRIKERKKIDND